jgi:hypothetical protein
MTGVNVEIREDAATGCTITKKEAGKMPFYPATLYNGCGREDHSTVGHLW